MWIAMALNVSGGRADGRPWPPAGEPFEVPDAEGTDLLRARIAYPVTRPEHPGSAPMPPPPAAEPGPVVSQPAATAAGPPDAAAPDPGPSPELVAAADGEIPEAPRPADPKQAWVDHAVAQGADPDGAAGLSKAQLMQAYGGRL